MQPNRILTEIRHTRDEMARAAIYDVKKFMGIIRAREREAAVQGVPFAPPTIVEAESCILREEPRKL
jgi:hypothetical protein